jgi:hypothetical protein
MKYTAAIGLALLCCGLACGTTPTSSDDDDGAGANTPTPESKVVTPSEGGVLAASDGDATLTVPPGAVAADVELTLEVVAPTSDSAGPVYRFGPASTVFEIAATLRVSTAAITPPADSELMLAKKVDGVWIGVGDAVAISGAIEGPVTTLGDFAIVAVEAPASPCEASCTDQPGAACCTACGCEAEIACYPTCPAGSYWDCEIGCCFDESFNCVE